MEKTRRGTHSRNGKELTLEEKGGGEGQQFEMMLKKPGAGLGKKSGIYPQRTGKPLAH